MRVSLPFKLMASYLLVAGLVVAPSLWFLRRSLVTELEASDEVELKSRVEQLRSRFADLPPASLDAAVRDVAQLVRLRVTVIAPSGAVVVDSEVPRGRVAAMENHLGRAEVIEALAGGFGHARRRSATLNVEFLYAAVPMPATGEERAVLRVARPAREFDLAVGRAIVAQRLFAGVGVSAAILLSLVAALFLSLPLRRMRDAARAFVDGRWVSVKRTRTGDELEDLGAALEVLGQRLRAERVEGGAQEALLFQSVRAFPLPAVVLDPELRPLVVNGAFRRFASITASNESERLAELSRSMRLLTARAEAEKSGLPVEMALPAPGSSIDGQARRAVLVPLARPGAPDLWMVLADLEGPESEAHGAEGVQRALRSAETLVESLWLTQAGLRPELARIRVRLDDAARAAGKPEAVGVEPVEAAALIERCAEEVRVLHPRLGERLVLDLGSGGSPIAESAGLAARAVRLLLVGALRALTPGRQLEVSLSTEGTRCRVRIEGAVPSELEPIHELARALGCDAGIVSGREREAAWLSLPRA